MLLAAAGSLSAQQTAGAPGSKRSPCPAVSIPQQPSAAPRRCGLYCGTERWQVKTLSDPDARRVRLTPVATTVESLATLRRPRYLPPYGRAARAETTVFCIEGWFKEVNTEADYDLHVIVAGLEDTTVTIVVEFPDARCSGACASGYGKLYTRARQALENRLKTWTTDTLRVRIMGVGFFDRPHGQWGAAPNYIELHPVLGIDFP